MCYQEGLATLHAMGEGGQPLCMLGGGGGGQLLLLCVGGKMVAVRYSWGHDGSSEVQLEA